MFEFFLCGERISVLAFGEVMSSVRSRLKVLHLITGIDTGGAENLLLATLRRLDRSAFNVTVAYLKGRGDLREEFEKEGIRVCRLRPGSRFAWLKAVDLFWLMKRERFDIVHAHLIAAVLLGRVVGMLAGVRIVVSTEHNTSNWEPGHSIVSRLYRWSSRWSAKIFAISEAVRRCVVEIGGVDPAKVEVLYDGVDLDRFSPREPDTALRGELLPADSFPVLGCVGRFDIRKGQRTLIEAVGIAQKRFRGTKLLLVGDGKLSEELRDYAARLGAADAIVFCGMRKDVERYLSVMDFFVLPSFHEGLSVALLEAMAMKRLVVATNVGGVPEVVESGVEGILVPAGNALEIVRAIEYILDHPQVAAAMREAARRKVEAKFDLSKLVSFLEKSYHELYAMYACQRT